MTPRPGLSCRTMSQFRTVPVVKAVLRAQNVHQTVEKGLESAIDRVKNLQGCNIRHFENSSSLQALIAGGKPAVRAEREVNINQTVAEGTFERIGRFQFDLIKYKPSPQELQNAPFQFADSKHSFITKDTPLCTDCKLLRGPNNDLLALAMQRGSGRGRNLHKCKWFTFHYWHTNSFLGNIIKSKPGIVVMCHNYFVFNSASTITGEIPKQIQNTAYPFKSAVYRTRVKKLIRRHFMDLYLRNQEFANQFYGLYKFTVSLYPRTEEEVNDLVKNIVLCLGKVSQMSPRASKKDAEEDLKKLPWFDVNRILERNNVINFPIRKPKVGYGSRNEEKS